MSDPRTARRRMRVGIVVPAAALAGVLLFALAGPLVFPTDPVAPLGNPFDTPHPGSPLGTDGLGRDVAARVLHGGVRLLAVGLGATALTIVAATALALLVAWWGGRLGERVMRVVDILGVLPGLLILLLVAAGFPHDDLAVAVAIAAVSTPHSTRVLRTSVQRITGSGFVEASRSRGDAWTETVTRDILPNLVAPLTTETGLRLATSLHLAATAGFLGLGQGPPAAHWGQMVRENLDGLPLNPWGVAAPALLMITAIVAVTVLADEISRRQRVGS